MQHHDDPHEIRLTFTRRDIDPYESDDPVQDAREWAEGYEYLLFEADRLRHSPQATEADYRRLLTWADKPDRDRKYGAIEVLRERIWNHPSPPYSPEVLISELDSLYAIPTRERVNQRFFERFLTWLDRVEAYLRVTVLGVEAKGDGAAQAVSATNGAASPRERVRNKNWRADVISLCGTEPELTDVELADRVGVHVKTLYRMPRSELGRRAHETMLKAMRMRTANRITGRPVAGFVEGKGDERRLEAVSDPHESEA